jgi:hypothetical protein
MARTQLPLSLAFIFGCFVVNHVILCQYVSQYFCFPLSVTFHQCTILILIYMLLLPEGQTDEDWVPSEKICYYANGNRIRSFI